LAYIPETAGVEKKIGQAQAQGFLNFFNPSPVSDLPSPNLSLVTKWQIILHFHCCFNNKYTPYFLG
jgi:hypothetical protein